MTEVRAGVYVFFDLVMANVGVCQPTDIALSVLTTVIGHQNDKGWAIVDAGWMAMSRDRGTKSQPHDYGYGQVCSLDGQVLDGLCAQRGQPRAWHCELAATPSAAPARAIGGATAHFAQPRLRHCRAVTLSTMR